MRSVKELEAELKLAKKVAADNKKFKAMSAAEKRVAIAKDVIAQVRAKKFYAKAGQYFALNGDYDEYRDDLQTLLCSGSTCNVCALGAVFASTCKIKNKYDIIDANCLDSHDVKQYLRGIFTAEQLSLVETAFEQADMTDSRIMDAGSFTPLRPKEGSAALAALEFGERFSDQSKRMIAIMQNIVDNGGTFKPGPNDAK